MIPALRVADLCLDDTPWAYFVASTSQSVDNFARLYAAHHRDIINGPVVRMFRGRRCGTVESLLQEWAAALQFPWYCGYVWDGFDECICDLEWLPGTCYLLFMTQFDLVLPGLDGELSIFIDILKGAAEAWKIPNRYNSDWPAAPFTVIFHAEPDQAAAALERLRTAGGDPVLVRLPEEIFGIRIMG